MRAFILGNSGELLDHDLDLLKGEVVFGCNALPLYKPDIITDYVCADIGMAFLPEIRSLVSPTCRKYYSRLLWNTIDSEDNVTDFDVIDGKSGFNISRNTVYLCNTVTYAALQIAASFNYNPIYLLGIDLGLPANGISHIPEQDKIEDLLKSKNLRSPTDDKRARISSHTDLSKTVNLNFLYARSVLEKEGIEVFNLSHGGNLNAFPRKSYEDVISNHQTGVIPEVELSN